ncbi:hypothetical protein LEM8419_01340 [Neolewinella maritima]|uniref:DUF3098 domain-containing protein n=1 Tax=Neolewinella maritima TaxID=1383882 RepID=A0ABM9AZB4_9BACT|nr:DUF3098 domain-containing protein [Neolewinella maritima]CAH1000192.1 hypothetical protein LEM8419_01340 [Neolewinella maritima]
MSKRKKQKGRSSTSVADPTPQAAAPIRVVATPKVAERRTTATVDRSAAPLVFGPDTYRWLGGGFLLVVVGFLFMIGGRGDDPTVFDEDVIYSFRRITLAPLIILSGLGVVVYAIFKK